MQWLALLAQWSLTPPTGRGPFCVACACCSRVCVGYFNPFNVCFQFSFRFRFRCLKMLN